MVLKDYFSFLKKLLNLKDSKPEKDLPIHEYFSYKIVTESKIADTIAKSAGNKDMVKFASNLLAKTQDAEFQEQYSGFKLLMQLVSSQLDADRMDYLLRDSMMSGVKFGLVDVDRIIKNMRILRDSAGKYQIAFHERAIGAIEDMLDARFKMYRWFYSHNTVVVINDLIERAIDMMTAKDEELAKLCHWSSYESGNSTDDYVLSKIYENQQLPEYQKVRGLVDRRYLPLSLFKSTPDTGRLIHKINKIGGVQLARHIVRVRIASFFEGDGSTRLKAKLEEKEGELAKCVIFHTSVKMKPYKPFEPHDRVYLFRTKEDELCELSTESDYFQAVNNEWGKFHGLYVSYLIPEKMKVDFSNLRDKIRDIIAEEIAKFES